MNEFHQERGAIRSESGCEQPILPQPLATVMRAVSFEVETRAIEGGPAASPVSVTKPCRNRTCRRRVMAACRFAEAAVDAEVAGARTVCQRQHR